MTIGKVTFCKTWKIVVAIWIALGATNQADADPKTPIAFPGAEGYGRFARGGRGGDVYHVKNLNDSGVGSLREGIRSATGPRTMVFDVSGTIELKKPLVVNKSFLTIAGQTAPGDGICLKDWTFEIRKASHIIVRYIRVRLGDQHKPHGDPDAITTNDVDNVIFDHITASWAIDGIHDLRRGANFTLQWSIYAEALNRSLHTKGEHAMLSSFRDLTGNISIHHNLFCSSRDRHPTLGSGSKTRPGMIIDFRNNVVYNLSGATNLGDAHINFINNDYRPGPNTPKGNHPLATKTGTDDHLKAYLSGNVFEGNPVFTANNYDAITFDRWADGGYRRMSLAGIRVNQEFDVGGARPQTQPAPEALEIVLKNAGASLHRDAADERLIKGVRDRTNRLIDSQDQVGGWPTLQSNTTLVDTDGDGMPDDWERNHGLNPADPKDGATDRDGDGFTNLEEYLNSLCPLPSGSAGS